MDWSTIKHFKPEEFIPKNINDSDFKVSDMNQTFIQRLDNAREQAQIPFIINDGIRSVSHNQQVGGKPDSTHLLGHAADIRAETSRTCFIIVKALMLAGFTRIEVSKDGHVHVDDGESVDSTRYVPNVLWIE